MEINTILRVEQFGKAKAESYPTLENFQGNFRGVMEVDFDTSFAIQVKWQTMGSWILLVNCSFFY